MWKLITLFIVAILLGLGMAVSYYVNFEVSAMHSLLPKMDR
jgi:hypothetical protein